MSQKLAKKCLRTFIQGKLNNVKEESVKAQSRYIFDTIMKNPKFQEARSIGLYMSMPQVEVDTMPLIEHCFENDKKVYLPKCVNQVEESRRSRHMKLLSVSTMDEVRALQPKGKYNLREPDSGEDVMDQDGLDFLVVPGLAFSRAGKRLGHGAGYYDEFLNAYEARFGQLPYLVGLSLQEQLEESIPTESHDKTLDKVIVGEAKHY